MKISFQNQDINEIINSKAGVNSENARQKTMTSNTVNAQTMGATFERTGKNNINSGNNKKSLGELQQEAGNIDVSSMENMQVVLSNTLSAEDYQEAAKEGFDYSKMDPEDIVTIQDRVKAEVAKGGTYVPGYNDDVEAAKKMAMELKQPGDQELKFLVDNNLEPRIWDLYVAQNSGAAVENQEIVPLTEDIEKQLEKLVDTLDLPEEIDTDKAMEDATWLVERQLEVNTENISLIEKIHSIEFPVKEEVVDNACKNALIKGIEPKFADLTDIEDVLKKAIEILDYYDDDEFTEKIENSLMSRRQIEEIRLSMTAEVNIKLLETDFSIDTAPIEEFIEALKQAEVQVAARYFPKEESPVNAYRLMNETNKAVEEIKTAPLATVGMFAARNIDEVNLSEFHEESKIRRDTYEKADESYEALMTAPRADLGDSITKAFSNVDDILTDLGLEKNDDNRRTVRILGYNHIEINTDNINKISEADNLVRSVVTSMKPASVLKMIREGVNPMSVSLQDLQKYLETQSQDDEAKREEYGRYLYSLDKADGITHEEREAFIGIYRMLHQIEGKDGAAVGAVIESQAELNFANLLSAVRTTKFGHINLQINDEFGGLQDIVREGKSITDQILTAFEDEFRQDEYERFKEALNMPEKANAMLEEAKMGATAENILAANALMSPEYDLFKELMKYANKDDDKQKARNILNKAFENFGEEISEENTAEVFDAAKELADELTLQEATNAVDVRSLQLISKQISIISAVNTNEDSEEFFVPMELDNEIVKVHVQFESSESSGNSADISFKLTDDDLTEVHLDFSENGLSGYITTNDESKVQKLNSISDIFTKSVNASSELDLEAAPIPAIVKGVRGVRRDNLREAYRTVNPSMDAKDKISEGADRSTKLKVVKQLLSIVKREG